MTEETRSHNAITNENIMLHEQLEQLRLKTTSARTQTYQTPGSEVEVDLELAEWMFWKGAEWEGGINHSGKYDIDAEIKAAIEAYKAQQPDSPTIDKDSD